MTTLPQYFDTHTHLNHPADGGEREEILARALDAGMWMVIVGSDYASSVRALEIAEQFPQGVYAALGVHPLAFGREGAADIGAIDRLVDVEAFRELARHPKVVAIGEVGLDFHDLHLASGGDELREELVVHLQYEALERFAELSREFRLPLILHVRDAHDEMIRSLAALHRHSPGFDVRGIVHHFTGDWQQACRYLASDFLLSFTGLLARSHTRHELIKKTPLSKFVVESECPHLIPTVAGSVRSEPLYLPNAITGVAAIRGLGHEAVRQEIARNALRLFPKIVRSLT